MQNKELLSASQTQKLAAVFIDYVTSHHFYNVSIVDASTAEVYLLLDGITDLRETIYVPLGTTLFFKTNAGPASGWLGYGFNVNYGAEKIADDLVKIISYSASISCSLTKPYD